MKERERCCSRSWQRHLLRHIFSGNTDSLVKFKVLSIVGWFVEGKKSTLLKVALLYATVLSRDSLTHIISLITACLWPLQDSTLGPSEALVFFALSSFNKVTFF